MTQGSSCLATAGLRAGIPLGFSNGTKRRQCVNAQGKRESFFASPRLGALALKLVAGRMKYCAGLATGRRKVYFHHMSTQEILLEEIKHQPEPVLRELWHYLKFLTRQCEEEKWADVLPTREVEQEVLDILDRK